MPPVLAPYSKLIAALVGALAFVAASNALHGTAETVLSAVVAALTPLTVYAVPNAPAGPPGASRPTRAQRAAHARRLEFEQNMAAWEASHRPTETVTVVPPSAPPARKTRVHTPPKAP